MHLLLAEDEESLNKILKKALEGEGYVVDACFDGDEALEYLESQEEYDGAILDVMMPGKNGFQVLEAIRKQGNETPVMFLTAKSATQDVVQGLDAGADDYMTKPFELSELFARLRVMLRKQPRIYENVFRCGPLEVNINEKSVKREGKFIDLSPKEFAVLLYLIKNKNIVVTREQIESNVWNVEAEVSSNVVDVYIRFLRKKIDDGYDEKMIQTIRGSGYVVRCND